MKKLFALLIALAVAVGIAVPAQANLDTFLSGLSLQKNDWLILTSEYGRDGQHSQLSIQPGRVADGETRADWIHCTSTKDPKCQGADALDRITASPILPDCSKNSTDICVEYVKFGNNNGELAPATYIGEVTKGTEFAAEPAVNLLEGAGLPIYENKTSVPVADSSSFAVLVRPQEFWDKSTKKFRIDRLEVKVFPYTLKPRSVLSLGCAFMVGDQCASLQDFAPETRVELKFRIPNDVGGWFSGRMKAPNISVAKYSNSLNTITISAEPVEVAALGIVRNEKDFATAEKTWNENHGKWSVGDGQWATGANSWQPDVFPFIEYYRPLVKDTSIGTNRVWNFMSIGGGSGSKCLADKSKVLGIVTTNALGYAGESPQFKNGFLDYKVAGLHYLPGGTDLVLGTYDLVMRSETARCLYGFSNAPLSATVSVTGGASKNVATTVVSEKNGWLKMAAYGFTFSKKTIKVKITKKKK